MTNTELRSIRSRPGEPEPNLNDYARACAEFRWERARRSLEGLPGGGLNIAHEAIGRHAASGLGAQCALRHLGPDGGRTEYSYAQLARLTRRFANVLAALGVAPGERVFALPGRTPEHFIVLFGTLLAGAVYCPLSASVAARQTRMQIGIGEGRVLVTTRESYRRNVQAARSELPGLRHVLLTDTHGPGLPPGTLSLAELMEHAPDERVTAPTLPDTPALLYFGEAPADPPVGTLHVHEAVVAHLATARFALDLHPGDIYWCTVDPGRATGINYGAIAPLVCGATLVVDERGFDAERWYQVLQEEDINVWYTTPVAIRRLRDHGNALATSYCFNRMRHIATTSEHLCPESVMWGWDIFAVPIHDTWSQARTGAIMIANFRCEEIRPGSMGRPVPGIEAAVVQVERDDEGMPTGIEVIETPGVAGELALRAGWPSMVRACAGDPAAYRRWIASGWYLTGDLAGRDQDGWYWHLGRADAGANTMSDPELSPGW